MSQLDTLTRFLQAMERDTSEMINAIRRRSPTADHVANADLLKNLSDLHVEDLFRAKIQEHTQVIAQNVHGVEPASLGTYPKETFERGLNALADNASGLPFSFYGDSEYPTPPVFGKLDHPTGWHRWGLVGMFLEDHGTLMFLRPGTDGVQGGVYYSYLRDAATTQDLSALCDTTVRYSPGYFPDGQIAMGILFNNADVIIGTLGDAVTYSKTGYFISLTRGTFDHTRHVGCVIPLGDILDPKVFSDYGNPGEDGVIYGRPCGYVEGDRVYILTDLDQEEGQRLGWRVWSIPVIDLEDGVYRGGVRETGWTINRGIQGTVTRDDIDLVDHLPSSGLIQTPSPADIWMRRNRLMHDNAVFRDKDGRLLATCGLETYLYKDDMSTFTQFATVLNFEIKPGRVIDISRYYNAPAQLSYPGDPNDHGANAWPSTPSPLFAYRDKQNQLVGCVASPIAHKHLYAEDNTVYSVQHHILSSNRAVELSRRVFDPTLKVIDLLDGADAYSETTVVPRQVFSSPVTVFPSGLCNAGDGCLFGRNIIPELGGMDWFKADYLPEFSHSYASMNGYTHAGFPPSLERHRLSETSSTLTDLIGCVNESDGDGWVLHKGRFDNVVNTTRIRPAGIGADGRTTGTITLTQSAFNMLEGQIWTALNNAGHQISNDLPGNRLWFEVVVPQKYSTLPPFIYGLFADQQRAMNLFVCSLDTGGQRQNITYALVIGSSMEVWPTSTDSVVDVIANLDEDHLNAGQVCIRLIDNQYVVGLTTSVTSRVIGDSFAHSALLTYGTGGWRNQGTMQNALDISHIGFVNFPTLGLYVTLCTDQSIVAMDSATKVVGSPVAPLGEVETLDVYLQRIITNDGSCRIILSQEVPEYRTIRITAAMPAMIQGQYETLPPLTYVIDPSFTTGRLYLWIIRQGNALSYRISGDLGTPGEVDGYIYLGYVDVDANGVSTIRVDKRVAVAGRTLSTVDSGMSIPVSAGLPSQPSRLNWR